jgi:DNA-binding GntR family transcriptional regulator
MDTRVVVEIGALPYTAKRMAEDPSVNEKLCKHVDAFRQTRDLQKWIELDIEFHRALLDASGLAPLVAFHDLMQIFFQRFRDSLKKADWIPGIEAHQRIIDALHNQDVALATNELRQHIEYHKGRMGVPE